MQIIINLLFYGMDRKYIKTYPVAKKIANNAVAAKAAAKKRAAALQLARYRPYTAVPSTIHTLSSSELKAVDIVASC